MIIAIDGPAASGKGTIARQIASVYGLHHLDTGLLYRAVAKAVLTPALRPTMPSARSRRRRRLIRKNSTKAR